MSAREVAQEGDGIAQPRLMSWTTRGARRVLGQKLFYLSLFLVVLLIFVAIFAPVLVPYDPLKTSPEDQFLPPSSQHWFGTDQYGRDMFARIVHATRLDLAISFSVVGLALLVLALLDYAYQWWRHEQDLKMTPQELREELKNLEGNPQVIARRKQVQRDLVLQRLSALVPQANVVLTNPNQLAVAVRYDPKTMSAPVVVAKGSGASAEHIRRVATEHGVPAIEQKKLARMLYRQVDTNRPIPADQYEAVAEVLTQVDSG